MNPIDLIKNLQGIQARAREIQAKMAQVSVTGSAGADMVRVEMNGAMEIRKVHISPEAIASGDSALLEDLVQAACTDAFNKMKERIREEMRALTGGLDLPPDLLGF